MSAYSAESLIAREKDRASPFGKLATSLGHQVKRTVGAAIENTPLLGSRNRSETHYTLGRGEILQLDIGGYKSFTVGAISGTPVQLANGDLAVKVSIDAELDDREYEIAVRSSGEDNVVRTQRKMGYMSIPVMRDETVHFYSRNEMGTIDPNMPLLRATFFVFGVRLARPADVSTRIDRIIRHKIPQ